MAQRTSKKSARVGQKAAKRVAAAPARSRKAAPASAKPRSRPPRDVAEPAGPRLLSGGNPQIAKGDGDGPVQAYIAAMPGWKREVGRDLDAIIVRAVPGVRKAVKWNSPFYGSPRRQGPDGEGWFMSFHCFDKYVKVGFFRGTSLSPLPPGESKQKEVRYLDIYKDDRLDESQFTGWVKQASKLPGERM